MRIHNLLLSTIARPVASKLPWWAHLLTVTWMLGLLGCTDQAATPLPSASSTSPPSKSASEGPEKEDPTFAIPPRITPPGDKKVLEIFNGNIDEDAEEEQILFLQSRNNLSLPIQIQVIDFDSTRKTYYFAWEGTTLASGNQPFNYAIEDLVGDHRQEVIIRGLDEKGRPCIDILRRIPAPGGNGIQYRSVLSLSTQGNVDIEKSPRSQAYESGQKSDVSFPVVLEESDPSSENILDTIKTTYNWKFQTNQFEKIKVEKYRRANQNDAALEKLFVGDNAGLEKFLSGPWFRPDSTENGSPLLLFFNTQAREIVFATDKTQEVYHWEVSSRTVRNGLYIVGSNDLINLIKLQMSLSISTADTIDVNAQDNPNWSGSYKRLNDSALAATVHLQSVPLPQVKGPAGQYKNDKGDEFQFELPYVTVTENGIKNNGAASLFILGENTILQIKLIGSAGETTSSRNYLLKATEEKTSSRIIRTLSLQRGTLTWQGWKSDMSDPVKLEQIEVFSESVSH